MHLTDDFSRRVLATAKIVGTIGSIFVFIKKNN